MKTRSDLSKIQPSQAGRNHSGKITVRHRGGGHKRRVLQIDWWRDFDTGKVVDSARGPRTNSRYFLIRDSESNYKWVPGTDGVEIGARIRGRRNQSFTTQRPEVGDWTRLSWRRAGDFVHSVAVKEDGPAVWARSGGCYRRIASVFADKVELTAPSGQGIIVPGTAWAILGVRAKPKPRREAKKAGRTRWLGIRPTVRGVARNPVDHPHGGGEGKTSGGRPSVTPWGKPKGRKTARPKPGSVKKIVARLGPLSLSLVSIRLSRRY